MLLERFKSVMDEKKMQEKHCIALILNCFIYFSFQSSDRLKMLIHLNQTLQ